MSESLTRLQAGLTEVRALLAANPVPRQGLPRFDVLRAIGRSSVVLTTSHFEAFIYGLTEEMSTAIIRESTNGRRLPVRLRLRHSSEIIEQAAATGWESREKFMIELFSTEGALWLDGDYQVKELSHERFLNSFKTPRAKPLIKYFRDWGIDDIFTAITRKPTTRKELFLRIDELGEKRNLIAHGDFTVQATASDIRRFLRAVDAFCTRSDRLMRKRICEITGEMPWIE